MDSRPFTVALSSSQRLLEMDMSALGEFALLSGLPAAQTRWKAKRPTVTLIMMSVKISWGKKAGCNYS